MSRSKYIKMFAYADINLLLCSYVDVADVSNLFLTNKLIHDRLSQYISIKKTLRVYDVITIKTRKVCGIHCDIIENIFSSKDCEDTCIVCDFGPVVVEMGKHEKYVIFTDKYCRARIIMIPITSTSRRGQHHSIITFAVKEYIDIYKILCLYRESESRYRPQS